MATGQDSDAVQPISSPTPPVEEKNAKLQEKVAFADIVELQTTTAASRNHLNDYLRTAQDAVSKQSFRNCGAVLWKFAKFTGPGTVITVAYVDPDNFQTDVSSGVDFKYKLLFMMLVSNLVAMYLQSLAIKLGTVTGLNLAQMNRVHLPKWLNYALWILAEAAIVCTDIGQVIGAAIAINILNPKIPLVAGCAISITDTLLILIFYRPDGSIRGLRAFEIFVSAFVLGIFICMCILLSLIENTSAKHVMDGFLPSRGIFVGQGLYQSCAIMGGTLMPHTIYLGSGLCQARLRDFDVRHDSYREEFTDRSSTGFKLYRPSLSAIKSCYTYSVVELCTVLFIISIFVNSAILIVGAAYLTQAADSADLFGMYDLFVSSISQGAGTMFALSLLFSGISAGIVATMAGQMIAEGAIHWTIKPFYRRLITRCTAVIPGIIVCAVAGRRGVANALNGTNVVLSISLIFLTFPLVWYTSFDKYMMVEIEGSVSETSIEGEERRGSMVSLKNGKVSLVFGWGIWVLITAMNVATFVFLGLGLTDLN